MDELENSENEQDTFPRAYVEELREEAKNHRLAAKEADDSVSVFRDAYRAAVLKEACAGALVEPLEWSDAYEGENGMPDPDKIKEAAEALALEKPHLSRVNSGVPQGPQGDDSDTVSLAGLLRQGA